MAISLSEIFAILAFIAQMAQIASDWILYFEQRAVERARIALGQENERAVGRVHNDRDIHQDPGQGSIHLSVNASHSQGTATAAAGPSTLIPGPREPPMCPRRVLSRPQTQQGTRNPSINAEHAPVTTSGSVNGDMELRDWRELTRAIINGEDSTQRPETVTKPVPAILNSLDSEDESL